MDCDLQSHAWRWMRQIPPECRCPVQDHMVLQPRRPQSRLPLNCLLWHMWEIFFKLCGVVGHLDVTLREHGSPDCYYSIPLCIVLCHITLIWNKLLVLTVFVSGLHFNIIVMVVAAETTYVMNLLHMYIYEYIYWYLCVRQQSSPNNDSKICDLWRIIRSKMVSVKEL